MVQTAPTIDRAEALHKLLDSLTDDEYTWVYNAVLGEMIDEHADRRPECHKCQQRRNQIGDLDIEPEKTPEALQVLMGKISKALPDLLMAG